MTPKEYAELLEYVHKNNGWKHTLVDNSRLEKPRPLIKYITSSLDTREGRVWTVTFRGSGTNVSFRIDSKEVIEDIYSYLRGDEFKYGITEEL